MIKKIFIGVIFLMLLAAIGAKLVVGAVNFPVGSVQVDKTLLEQRVILPEGFALQVFADDVPNARLMRITRNGDVLLATPNRDQVLLLRKDMDGDGRHDGKEVLLDNLNSPNGMDLYNGWLYVAETDAIGRVKFDPQTGKSEGNYEHVVTDLPAGKNHYKKTLRFGPDKMMYVTMGSSCNVCIEKDKRRATMMRYKPDGSDEELYATGLRNSAGFDWDVKGRLFATDNGRDLLGDDYPPCELNEIKQGAFYGWPFANGNNEPDPDFGEGNEALIQEAVPPVHGFKAHNAPLGIHFLKSDNLPDEYRQAALVALHGSWNRTEKDGYKVVSIHWQQDGTVIEKDFMTGFLQDDKAIGRPAEIEEGLNGEIYISDDYAGAIYKITYQP